ncbi:hypothetical protein MMC29_006888 [Sticta canariensis]|nr:hypothetical protein [Sticta canariensis]
MAGWFEIRHQDTFYHKSTKAKDPSWPPKYWKFTFETAEEPKCEAAFIDFRRLARIRLIDCAAKDIRHLSPLKENGPDPVIDREVLTEEWLSEKLASKKLHVKTFLLDQANISGIGNWVGDEILYHAAIHPETNTRALSTSQVSRLYNSLHEVSSLAVSTHADPEKFPDTWLFKHRWGKGKKDSPNTLLNGAKISFITVGGRTTAVVASVQKKTDALGRPEENSDEPEKAAEGDSGVEQEITKAKKSRLTNSAPAKKPKASKELQETTTLAQPPKGKSRAVKQKDHPTTPGITDTEGKPETAEELPKSTATTPAKTSDRENRVVKNEVGPPTPEPTDTKAETKAETYGAPTSIASKKRKAETEAPPTESGPITTSTSAANPPSKMKKTTPSRSSIDCSTELAVITEPVTSSQGRKKTKASAKDIREGKSRTESKGALVTGAAVAASAGDEKRKPNGGETRRRSRRVSGRSPG